MDDPFIQEIIKMLIDNLLPIVIGLLLAIITPFITRLSTVAKDKYNIDIDAQLNRLLHVAIERLAQAIITKYGAQSVLADPALFAKMIADQLRNSNPDAVARFGLDKLTNGDTLMTKLIKDSLVTAASATPVVVVAAPVPQQEK